MRVSIVRVLLGTGVVVLLLGCGHPAQVTVVDKETGKPLQGMRVEQERRTLQFMGIVPMEVLERVEVRHTDAHGRVALRAVRDGDVLTVLGHSGDSRTWFSPLRPLEKTKSGPDTQAAVRYRAINANQSADEITLPVSRVPRPEAIR